MSDSYPPDASLPDESEASDQAPSLEPDWEPRGGSPRPELEATIEHADVNAFGDAVLGDPEEVSGGDTSGESVEDDWTMDPRREPIPLFFNPRARGNEYRGVKRFLVFASGARPEILAQCPTDEATHVGLGGTVVATAFLSGISMFFAMYKAMGVLWLVALLAGITWSLIIFNLDRWLIVSQKRAATTWKQWAQVIPRVLVAVLLGFVISEPLLHQLFGPKLEQEIQLIRSEGVAAEKQRIEGSDFALDIVRNNDRIKELETLSTGDTALEAQLNAEIKVLEDQTKAALDKYDALATEVTKEIEGLGPNGMTGCGPACVVKSGERDRAREEWESVKARNQPVIDEKRQQLNDSRASSRADREKRQEQVRDEINTLNDENTRNRAIMDKQLEDYRTGDDKGLLDYIEALGSLSAKNSSIFWARWLIFGLFIALDTIPVIGKTLLLTGPKRPYELACDAIDARLEQDAELVVDEARVEREQQLSLIERQAQIRVDVQAENNEHFVRSAAETQREIGDLLLSRWRADQLERVERQLQNESPRVVT